jgi:ABC-type sulfate/molybdate transport systems ATPase subunit
MVNYSPHNPDALHLAKLGSGVIIHITSIQRQLPLPEATIAYATHQTVFMITHDVDEAILLADKILLVSNGPHARIAAIGGWSRSRRCSAPTVVSPGLSGTNTIDEATAEAVARATA